VLCVCLRLCEQYELRGSNSFRRNMVAKPTHTCAFIHKDKNYTQEIQTYAPHTFKFTLKYLKAYTYKHLRKHAYTKNNNQIHPHKQINKHKSQNNYKKPNNTYADIYV